MPDVYVFPGGTLEPDDRRVRPVTALCQDRVAGLAASASATRATGLALAAVRETFEETGFALGQPGDPGEVQHPSWRAFRAFGLAPALHALRYVGRAITPAQSPRRFHARFFAVAASHLTSAREGDGELADLRWVPANDPGNLAVIDVTKFMLGELLRCLNGDRDATPLMRYRGDHTLVRYERH